MRAHWAASVKSVERGTGPASTADRVHIWWSRLAASGGSEYRDWYDLISKEEQLRCDRFVKEEDRRRFLHSRWLVRQALSAINFEKPAEWRFVANRFGKPFVTNPEARRRVRFNASHASGVVACVVSNSYQVGIDVEKIQNPWPVEVARHSFSPEERHALDSLDLDQKAAAFYRIWTLKEAYTKARGLGLSVPIQSVRFVDLMSNEPRVTFGREVKDKPTRWKFFSPTLVGPYQMAVAVRVRGPERLSFDVIGRSLAT